MLPNTETTKALREAGVSQADLAKACRSSQTKVSLQLSGLRPLTGDVIEALGRLAPSVVPMLEGRPVANRRGIGHSPSSLDLALAALRGAKS